MKSRVFVVLTRLLFVLVSAPAVGLFQYRYHADDGREVEYVFETVECEGLSVADHLFRPLPRLQTCNIS
jgi:hypothetical protein